LETSNYTIVYQEGPSCKPSKEPTIRFRINPNKQHLSYSSIFISRKVLLAKHQHTRVSSILSSPFSIYYHHTSIILPLPPLQRVWIPNGEYARNDRLWIMDPNVNDPNERPLGCRTQTSLTLCKEATCWLGCPCHHGSWNEQTHTGLYSTSYSR
jgi:hypothetical protein